jgi:hypothetical protein
MATVPRVRLSFMRSLKQPVRNVALGGGDGSQGLPWGLSVKRRLGASACTGRPNADAGAPGAMPREAGRAASSNGPSVARPRNADATGLGDLAVPRRTR